MRLHSWEVGCLLVGLTTALCWPGSAPQGAAATATITSLRRVKGMENGEL